MFVNSKAYNKYTLSFENEDINIEWTHQSIQKKKLLILFSFFFVGGYNSVNELMDMKQYFYVDGLSI